MGRKADSRNSVKARGQFQIFDTRQGWVSNQARFAFLGQQVTVWCVCLRVYCVCVVCVFCVKIDQTALCLSTPPPLNTHKYTCTRTRTHTNQGYIQVDGPAVIEGSADGSRLVATFTEAELRLGKFIRCVNDCVSLCMLTRVFVACGGPGGD